jgi:hypothetical protein
MRALMLFKDPCRELLRHYTNIPEPICVFCPMCKDEIDQHIIQIDDYVGENCMYICESGCEEVLLCLTGINSKQSTLEHPELDKCSIRMDKEQTYKYAKDNGFNLSTDESFDYSLLIGIAAITHMETNNCISYKDTADFISKYLSFKYQSVVDILHTNPSKDRLSPTIFENDTHTPDLNMIKDLYEDLRDYLPTRGWRDQMLPARQNCEVKEQFIAAKLSKLITVILFEELENSILYGMPFPSTCYEEVSPPAKCFKDIPAECDCRTDHDGIFLRYKATCTECNHKYTGQIWGD